LGPELIPDENSLAPLPPQNPAGRSPLATIFLNEREVRAGWRLLLYLAITVNIFLGVKVLLGHFLGYHPKGFENIFAVEVTGFVSAFGAALIMSLIERRSVDAYGLPRTSAFGKMFWFGWLAGFAEISLLIGLIAAFGGYSFGDLALHDAEIARWAALWALCMLFVGFFEEFLFRGYSLFTLTTGMGFWPAAVLLSLLFGWVHLQNDGENWIGVGAVVLVGLLWCFTVRRTGSLWFAVGMHAAFDFGETFLYSVPDSGQLMPGHLSNATLHGPVWLTGGLVGPEASIIDFALLLLFFVAVHLLFPARNAPQADTAALQRTSSEANTSFTP
jgi:membrane protease YdiL (CAAX protease family)